MLCNLEIQGVTILNVFLFFTFYYLPKTHKDLSSETVSTLELPSVHSHTIGYTLSFLLQGIKREKRVGQNLALYLINALL